MLYECSWHRATCLITCQKGTGYVPMSHLPDDEDEVSWGFRCCGVVVVLCGLSGILSNHVGPDGAE